MSGDRKPDNPLTFPPVMLEQEVARLRARYELPAPGWLIRLSDPAHHRVRLRLARDLAELNACAQPVDGNPENQR